MHALPEVNSKKELNQDQGLHRFPHNVFRVTNMQFATNLFPFIAKVSDVRDTDGDQFLSPTSTQGFLFYSLPLNYSIITKYP